MRSFYFWLKGFASCCILKLKLREEWWAVEKIMVSTSGISCAHAMVEGGALELKHIGGERHHITCVVLFSLLITQFIKQEKHICVAKAGIETILSVLFKRHNLLATPEIKQPAS